MATDITINTTHDTPLFDPEDHRKLAAEQLGADPTAIHCTANGPDSFTEKQAAEYSDPLFSEDGTLLRPAQLTKPRIVIYNRNTTWALKPIITRDPEPEPIVAPAVVHAVPKLSRGARWHGIIDGVEGYYMSTGDDMVMLDSAEGRALLAQLHSEQAPAVQPTAT